jgi:hypothetical protein
MQPRIDTEPKQVSFASPEGVDPKAPNKLLLEAATRNEARLTQANLDDTNTLGKASRVNLTIFGGTGSSNRGSWIAATMTKIGFEMWMKHAT